jgi:hypothetical protein
MQASKLLGTLLPSIPVMHAILEKIREKYNSPRVLPEHKQLAEILRAERTPEEWRAVFDDLQRKLQGTTPSRARLCSPNRVLLIIRLLLPEKQPSAFLRGLARHQTSGCRHRHMQRRVRTNC